MPSAGRGERGMIWNLTGPLRPWPGAVTTGMGQATGDASAAKQYGYCWRINRSLLGFFSSAPLTAISEALNGIHH